MIKVLSEFAKHFVTRAVQAQAVQVDAFLSDLGKNGGRFVLGAIGMRVFHIIIMKLQAMARRIGNMKDTIYALAPIQLRNLNPRAVHHRISYILRCPPSTHLIISTEHVLRGVTTTTRFERCKKFSCGISVLAEWEDLETFRVLQVSVCDYCHSRVHLGRLLR